MVLLFGDRFGIKAAKNHAAVTEFVTLHSINMMNTVEIFTVVLVSTLLVAVIPGKLIKTRKRLCHFH